MRAWTLNCIHCSMILFVFVLSIVQIGLEASTRHSLNDSRYYISWPPQTGTDWLANKPGSLILDSSNALLASAALDIASVVFAAFYGISHWNTKISLEKIARLYHASLGITALTTLVIFIYACVAEQQSSTWHYSDIYSSESRLTPESWVCQLREPFDEAGYDFSRICGLARAGRFLSVPIFLLLLGVLVLVWFKKRHMRNEQILGKHGYDLDEAPVPPPKDLATRGR